MISSLQHHHSKNLPSHSAMKELLSQSAAYNAWANLKLLEVINSLPEEKQKAEVPSSFSSLYKTVLHMWDAESAWWQRMKMHERIIIPSENFKGSMKDVSNGLLAQSNQWKDWIDNASEMALEHVFQYYNTKREMFKQPVFQVILHVFNHDNYHRGQLVNMFRQLGVEKIPQTDFIVWSRKK
jgi:uncharacterized damage-inducible protein DinB